MNVNLIFSYLLWRVGTLHWIDNFRLPENTRTSWFHSYSVLCWHSKLRNSILISRHTLKLCSSGHDSFHWTFVFTIVTVYTFLNWCINRLDCTDFYNFTFNFNIWNGTEFWSEKKYINHIWPHRGETHIYTHFRVAFRFFGWKLKPEDRTVCVHYFYTMCAYFIVSSWVIQCWFATNFGLNLRFCGILRDKLASPKIYNLFVTVSCIYNHRRTLPNTNE